MSLGHSLLSHAANIIYFHFSESLFMAKSALETCTSLEVRVCHDHDKLYSFLEKLYSFSSDRDLQKMAYFCNS